MNTAGGPLSPLLWGSVEQCLGRGERKRSLCLLGFGGVALLLQWPSFSFLSSLALQPAPPPFFHEYCATLATAGWLASLLACDGRFLLIWSFGPPLLPAACDRSPGSVAVADASGLLARCRVRAMFNWRLVLSSPGGNRYRTAATAEQQQQAALRHCPLALR